MNGEVVDASAAVASFNTRTDDPVTDSGLVSISLNYWLTERLQTYGEYSKNFGNSLNDDHVVRLGVAYSFQERFRPSLQLHKHWLVNATSEQLVFSATLPEHEAIFYAPGYWRPSWRA